MKTSSLHSPVLRLTRFVLAASVVAALAACSSSVKLEDTPVADGVATSAGANAGGADAAGVGGSGVGQRAVSGVDANAFKAGQPPANLSRVVYFDFDSYAVRSEFNATLEGHAKFLNADRQRRVNLEGHTDERGGREYNLALGQKRAEAVRRALAVSGVNDAQMEAVSFGKEKPAAQGSNEEAWAKNRRVELTYR